MAGCDALAALVALGDRRHGASAGRGAFGAMSAEPPGRLGHTLRVWS
jgi:hypothetical protein